MELLQLKYFCTVAEYENYTQAAAVLLVAQPSLSRSIKRLEDELGTTLFDHCGRNVRLNETGKMFYEKVSEGLLSIQQGMQMVTDTVEKNAKELKVLVLAASTFMHDFYIQFVQKYPEIKIDFMAQNWNDRNSMLKFDICITASPDHFQGYSSYTLMEERLMLAVSKKNLVAENEDISLLDLKDYPLIMYHRGYPIRELTEQICKKAGLEIKRIYECDNNASFSSLIAGGLGVALVPEKTMPSIFNSEVAGVSIREEYCKRQLKLYYKNNISGQSAVDVFRKECIDYFNRIKNI